MNLFHRSGSKLTDRPAATFFGGIGIGAALMYLLDPDRGKRRRALVRDKAVGLAHAAGGRLGARSRDLRNRAGGIAARASSLMKEAPAGDEVLEARVRSEMGRVVRNSGAIAVSASAGHVTLSGPILSSEKDELLSRAKAVEGVEDVEDRLDAHESPDDIPSLQGGKGPRGKPERGASRFESNEA
jgi:hypothetical protein